MDEKVDMKKADTFGEYVRNKRLAHDIYYTRGQLSKKIKMSHPYVRLVEEGKIEKPNYDTCVRLLRALGEHDEDIDNVLRSFGITKCNSRSKIPKTNDESNIDDSTSHMLVLLNIEINATQVKLEQLTAARDALLGNGTGGQ